MMEILSFLGYILVVVHCDILLLEHSGSAVWAHCGKLAEEHVGTGAE